MWAPQFLATLIKIKKKAVFTVGSRIIGTPDRKLTNNTQKNSKQYSYRQTRNTDVINTVDCKKVLWTDEIKM